MHRPRVLYVTPNHPAIRRGGLELYALDLYEAVREAGEFEPFLLARSGPPFTPPEPQHADASLSMAAGDPHQYLFSNGIAGDLSNYDALFGRVSDGHRSAAEFATFLREVEPDIVHFQHTLFLGYDLIRVTRNTLPGAPIVMSLHEYVPICHRDGQMVRTVRDELCREESPRRCNECFPQVSPSTFYMRKRYIQSHLGLVDRFIAPTEYVRARYVEWGLDAGRMEVEPQGFTPAGRREDEEDHGRAARDRFAFFGQLNPYKGADVLLRAMDILGEDFQGSLHIYGGNLDMQDPRWQERFGTLLRTRENVTFVAGYDRDDLGKLMSRVDWVVIPSIWWETGPLVVWEAFQHGRPVICSDIGGMSEKVTDGVDGLHFRRGDADDLADTMLRAATTPGLWERLRTGIREDAGHDMALHVARMSAVYRQLLSAGRARPYDVAGNEVAHV